MSKRDKKRGGNSMAVMTADCKRAFSVAPNKATEFKAQKCNKNTIKKIEMATAKLEKNLKVNVPKK